MDNALSFPKHYASALSVSHTNGIKESLRRRNDSVPKSGGLAWIAILRRCVDRVMHSKSWDHLHGRHLSRQHHFQMVCGNNLLRTYWDHYLVESMYSCWLTTTGTAVFTKSMSSSLLLPTPLFNVWILTSAIKGYLIRFVWTTVRLSTPLVSLTS